MNTQLYCPDETRKALVRAEGVLNGIDYLEVLDDEAPAGSPIQQTLLVHCFLPVAGLTRRNVQIEGGVRITGIGVVWAFAGNALELAAVLQPDEPALQAFIDALPDRDQVLVVRTDTRGDFATYVLRLILSPTQPDRPPPGFDPLLASVPFSFKVDCPSDFDCQTAHVCPEPSFPEPQIDYLAKDYASFRRLMLDRLAVTMPDWRVRNPADLGIALVEVLAYAADHLSYHQDAVATEAYLNTARRRVSVRRHARLAGYAMHDGANARAWVCFSVADGSSADGATLPAGTRLLSRESAAGATVRTGEASEALASTPIVFETLHDVTLSGRRNAIPFYTWGDPNCALPRGATRATLRGGAADLGRREGDVLIFEEVLGPASGRAVDADPAHRHAVRLSAPPQAHTDPRNGQPVLEITWHAQDALPFPLCLREFPDATGQTGQPQGASVARGNVALADHGRTFVDEPLLPAQAPEEGRYRPQLQRSGLTHALPYDDETARAQAATAAMRPDVRRAVPQVTLHGDGETWQARRDLLNSDRFAPEFVVEMEEDGRTTLRFGDDVLGRAPAAGATFTATYRVGNGRSGNVGAESITRVVTDVLGITAVRNPLPAGGGTDPEPLEQVRLYAPQAFRTQERAITEDDYAAVAQRHPEVQRAAATRRWTGSWYTMFVTVDRQGGRPVDARFEAELRRFVERFRLAGDDLEIDAPRFVPLDIALTVCIVPGFHRSSVRQALLETFSSVDLPSGQRGFFHPDNFTFGQPVYLSKVIATAMEIPGVHWVDIDDTPPKPNRFRRWGEAAHGEIAAGRITFGRLEIARLDNDPNRPENGRIEFFMQGGL
ncbi:MAG: putative baseplate assembly protein [Chloroflexota bacterium]